MVCNQVHYLDLEMYTLVIILDAVLYVVGASIFFFEDMYFVIVAISY